MAGKIKDKDDWQEYNRIQQELISRINLCYNDGAMLASFFLIFYASIISGLISCFQVDNANTMVLLFGIISAVAFFFPIIVLHAFAVKFKENFSAICNLSAFSAFYYERPSIFKTETINGPKWELLHKNTISLSTRHESKEYFLLALTSLFFLAVSSCFLIYIYITNVTAVNLIYFILTATIHCCFLFVGGIFVYKIYSTTNMFNLTNIANDTKLFYEIQSEKISGEKASCTLYDEILKFNKEEEILNLFLSINRIPDYKASEIIKMYYNKINETDYAKIRSNVAKKIIKKAHKSRHGNVK